MALLALVILSLGWILSDHFPPWTSFHAEVPAFAATVLALIGIIFIIKQKRTGLMLPVALIWPLLLLFTVAYQWVGGQIVYGGDALIASIYMVVFAIAWVWGYQWADLESPGELLATVCAVFLFAGLVTAWQVLAQWLLVEGYFYGWVLDATKESKPTGNLGQPNQTATLLLMASVAAAILSRMGRYSFKVLWAVLPVFGWAIVLTQSRTAIVSAAAITVAHFLLYRSDPARRNERIVFIAWFVSMILAGLVLQQTSVATGAVSTKPSIGVESMIAPGGRLQLWAQLLTGLMDSPWRGYGWLQISSAHQAGAMQVPGAIQANYAHNALLDLALVVGIPAALLILGLLTVWLGRRFQAICRHPEAAQATLLIIPFLVHTQLELPHAYAYFLVPVGLLMGAADRWTRPSNAVVWRSGWKTVLVCSCAWTVLLLAIANEYILAEEDFRVNRFENRRLGKTPSDYQVPDLILLTQLEEMLKAMRLRAQPGMKPEEIETLKRVSARYTWAPMLYRTALACALNHQFEEAARYLLVIKRMFPAEIYEEGRESWLQLQKEDYPELARVHLP